jgi:hypothetical protein
MYPAVLVAVSCLVAAGATLIATREAKRVRLGVEASVAEVETPS